MVQYRPRSPNVLYIVLKFTRVMKLYYINLTEKVPGFCIFAFTVLPFPEK
jgi:hypothetical protein